MFLQAQDILNDVKSDGIKGLLKHAVRLKDLPSEDSAYLISRDQLEQSFLGLSENDRGLLERTGKKGLKHLRNVSMNR